MAWFSLHDWTAPDPGYQIFLQTGLTHLDWTPKPSVKAYQTLRHEVGRRSLLRRLDAAVLGNAGLDGYAFGTAENQVWVVWSRSEAVQPLTVSGSAPDAAYDMYNAPLSLTGSDCVVIVTDHSDYNWEQIADQATRIVDTRRVIRPVPALVGAH